MKRETHFKERFERTLPYLIAAIIIYNLSPIVMALLQSPLYNLLPPFYLCTNLVIAFIFGKKHGSDPMLAVVVTLAFIPTMFMFFNASAWLYAVAYFALSILGEVIGKVYGNRFKFR